MTYSEAKSVLANRAYHTDQMVLWALDIVESHHRQCSGCGLCQ